MTTLTGPGPSMARGWKSPAVPQPGMLSDQQRETLLDHLGGWRLSWDPQCSFPHAQSWALQGSSPSQGSSCARSPSAVGPVTRHRDGVGTENSPDRALWLIFWPHHAKTTALPLNKNLCCYPWPPWLPANIPWAWLGVRQCQHRGSAQHCPGVIYLQGKLERLNLVLPPQACFSGGGFLISGMIISKVPQVSDGCCQSFHRFVHHMDISVYSTTQTGRERNYQR